MSPAAKRPHRASIPTGAPSGGEAAAEVETPGENDSPTTEHQCQRDEGIAVPFHEECGTSNYSSNRQKYLPITVMSTAKTSSGGFFLPSYTSRGKEGGTGTPPKGFKTQLSCFRLIFSPGIVLQKISNPLCNKQSWSGFHFSFSAISPKGDPESLITSQKHRMGTEVWEAISAPGGSGSTEEHVSPGSGYHTAHAIEAGTTSLPARGCHPFPNSPSETCTAET